MVHLILWPSQSDLVGQQRKSQKKQKHIIEIKKTKNNSSLRTPIMCKPRNVSVSIPVIRQPIHNGSPNKTLNATALPTISWMSLPMIASCIIKYSILVFNGP
mmetsp:Transcript_248/g.541  ORF Transcript_248/g.541 Transcript_248/m.541 type:complete len:102 (-) Transcript_248:914-1219(-)